MNDMSSNMANGARTSFIWESSYNEGVKWDMEINPCPVYELLDKSAAQFPKNKCSSFMGKDLTYSEIQNLVNRAAKGLQERGIGKGSKVGLMVPNSPVYLIFYYAILKTGATVVNYNPLYSIPELTHQISDSGTEIMVTLDIQPFFSNIEKLLETGALPKALICPMADFLPGAKSFLFKMFKGKDIGKPAASKFKDKMYLYKDVIKNDGKYQPVEIDVYKDLALLQYTGGTTGVPKGAMLTHANVSTNAFQCIGWYTDGEPGKEVVIAILPFFHVFAMTAVMNFGIAMGAELVMFPKFDIETDIKIIAAKKPTLMPGVPTLFNGLMNYPKLSKYDFSSLKYCVSGGAPLPLEIKGGFEALSNSVISEGYGLSETSPVATSNPSNKGKEGSIGTPVQHTIVSIRDLENPEQEAPLGERGEICIKGPQVMAGYWNKPEETANVMLGDFLRTGDIGYMDPEGYIYIVDRIKDLILCSGYNVYPRQIEEAIYQHPAVEEVTVIGIPNQYRGEAPKAFVKLKEGQTATEDEIKTFLKDILSKIEMPEEVEFRDELPKTMIGKLSKKELRDA